MTKSEARELAKCHAYAAVFESSRDPATLALIARMLGTLVRSTRSDKTRRELMQAADALEVSGHSDFIVARY